MRALALAIAVLGSSACAATVKEAPLQASARADHPYEVFYPETSEFGKAGRLIAAPAEHERNVIADHFTVELPPGWTVGFDKPSSKFVQTARLANAAAGPTVTLMVSETQAQPSKFDFNKLEKAKRHEGLEVERGKMGAFEFLHFGTGPSFTRMATNDDVYIVIHATTALGAGDQARTLVDGILLH